MTRIHACPASSSCLASNRESSVPRLVAVDPELNAFRALAFLANLVVVQVEFKNISQFNCDCAVQASNMSRYNARRLAPLVTSATSTFAVASKLCATASRWWLSFHSRLITHAPISRNRPRNVEPRKHSSCVVCGEWCVFHDCFVC